MNYFELFGLPIQFELDGGLLASQFRELQRQFHPDNFATASERDQLLSVRKAAQINDAYQVLKHPISRAETILMLNGFDIKGEQKTLQDPMFLMEQMELREELENITSEDDLSDFDNKVSKMYKNSLLDVKKALDESQWNQAVDRVRKLKFMVKLQSEVERAEDKLLG